MKYIVISSIFIINFILWRFIFTDLSLKIIKTKPIFSYILSTVCILLLPYSITVFVFIFFEIDTRILSNNGLVFSLLIFILVFRKSFDNETIIKRN